MVRNRIYALFLTLLLCICTLFCCSKSGDDVVTTGGSEVWGTLTDPDGAALDSVLVRAVPADQDNPDSDNAVDTVFTDASGKYEFGDLGLSETLLNIYGAYRDSQYIVYIPEVSYQEDVVNDVGTIAMYAPGKIEGYVLTEQADHSGVRCYIPGTSFAAWTDSTGYFKIFAAPPGTHTLRYEKTNYQVATETVTVEKGQTSTIPSLSLTYDTSYVPVPTGLSASYDTLQGNVTLRWNPVKVPDLEGYNLYRDEGTALKINTSIILDTFYSFTVFTDKSDTSLQFLKIQVAAEDSFNNIGNLSRPVEIHAVSPVKVRTFFEFSLLDSPSVLDPVRIEVGFHNATRRVDRLMWAVDYSDSVIRDIQVSSSEGFDTLQYLWPDSGTKSIYVTARDNAGDYWYGTLEVSIDGRELNLWQSAPSCIESRRFFSCGVLDSVLYAVGGCYDDPFGVTGRKSIAIKSVEAFDPQNGGWTERQPLNKGRYNHGVAVANGKLYVIGGSSYYEDLKSIEEYDPVLDTFRIIDSLPHTRSGLAVVSLDNKLYLIGGLTFANGEFKISSSIDEYDPQTRTVTHKADMLIPRTNHQAVVIDDTIYILGGLGGNESLRSSETAPQKTVETYVPGEARCAQGVSMGTERFNFAAATVRGKLYVMGGFVSQIKNEITGSCEEFDLSTGEWSEKAPMPEPRHGMGVGVINRRIYVPGGSVKGYPDLGETERMEIYTP
ncbi:MAG: hypothetical protein GF401_19520 [Chitinivibrionales bacterium]|nr:hypothetical protein [Chitinivibrionales bacterium]